MHMQGQPSTMQENPHYTDVCTEVQEFFQSKLHTLQNAGISPEQLVFDPGIGFGKSLEHNLALLAHVDQLSPEGRPLLLGVSRKSFMGRILGDMSLARRSWPTVALTAQTRSQGVRLFRVHEIKPNVDALRMSEAILHA
jgi:dihydropteroate synthase